MTLLGFDGCDLYNGLTTGDVPVTSKWTVLNSFGNPQYQAAAGRFGGGAIRLTAPGGIAGLIQQLGGSATFSMGGSAKVSGASGSADRDTHCVMAAFETTTPDVADTTAHLMIQFESGNLVKLYRGTTLIGTSSAIPGLFGNYHWVELNGTINDSSGVGQVWVDGTKVIDFSGDTRNGGASGVINAAYWGFNQSVVDWDDMYWSTTGTPLGERRVDVLVPNADTADKDFLRSTGSNNYALIDEVPNNGDSDYVYSSTSGDKDYYGLSDLPSSSASIDAVQPSLVARRDDVGAIAVKLNVKSSSTESAGSSLSVTTSYAMYQRLLLTDPNTSAAWGDSGVNALNVGASIA